MAARQRGSWPPRGLIEAGEGTGGGSSRPEKADAPCPNGAWPTSDCFQASNYGQEVITGYIVLDQAFTPSTDWGEPTSSGRCNCRLEDRDRQHASGRQPADPGFAGHLEVPFRAKFAVLDDSGEWHHFGDGVDPEDPFVGDTDSDNRLPGLAPADLLTSAPGSVVPLGQALRCAPRH